jgi:hypothetical protein
VGGAVSSPHYSPNLYRSLRELAILRHSVPPTMKWSQLW